MKEPSVEYEVPGQARKCQEDRAEGARDPVGEPPGDGSGADASAERRFIVGDATREDRFRRDVT